MRVDTLIPKNVQSKSFRFRDPKSKSPKSNAKLSIELKKLNSSMYVLIHIINGNNRYVNCLCPFLPLATEHSDAQL